MRRSYSASTPPTQTPPTQTPPTQTPNTEAGPEEGLNTGGSNLLRLDPSAVTSPEPFADMFPLIVLAAIVVIGGIALGKYSKRNRARRIRISPSAVVEIHTKGGTRE